MLRRSVEKVIVQMRSTVAISRDYPGKGINREVVEETIAQWAEELAEAVRDERHVERLREVCDL